MRTIIAALVVVLGVAGAWLGYEIYNRTASETAAPYGVPFSLTDQDGQPITEAAFRGHPTVLFFGFTHCPEICPTTLYELSTWFEELGDEGAGIKAYFVSIDPERDTPVVLADYVSNLDPRIIGLTGPAEEVAQAAADFRVTYRRVDKDGGDYTMDHTAGVFLFHPDGRFVSIIDFHEDRRFAVPKIRRTLS